MDLVAQGAGRRCWATLGSNTLGNQAWKNGAGPCSFGNMLLGIKVQAETSAPFQHLNIYTANLKKRHWEKEIS